MIIGTVKETKASENRVALSPEVVKNLIKQGFECCIETGAGVASNFSDAAYEAAGAKIAQSTKDVCNQSDVLVKVNAPSNEEIADLKEGSALISFIYHLNNADLISALNAKKITVFSMDAIPRISRAQSMDALSSQANLAGYKAVILGANHSARIFPMLMTAAGTITPSKVLIFGAGVAGLQAIGTAKRLGAVVEVTDIRPETKEQVESLGGKFISFDTGEVKIEGGYVKETSEDTLKKQREILGKHLAAADIAITTALIPGKKAPILVSRELVKQMRPGSVIVDVAVDQGGCVETLHPTSHTQPVYIDEGVVHYGVPNMPGAVPWTSTQALNNSTLPYTVQLAKLGLKALDINPALAKGLNVQNHRLVHSALQEVFPDLVS
jgi:NAD(P) transhydrogenase subunit alpha